jgi:hypothetical protein
VDIAWEGSRKMKPPVPFLILLVLFVCASYAQPPAADKSWPELRAAPVATSRVQIAVGANVQISQAREKQRHAECVIAADPKKANRLFAAAMFWRKGEDSSIIGYYSRDGGVTWKVGFEADPTRANERLCDESVVYGPDGTLYLGHMRFQVDKATSDRFGQEGPGAIVFHRSTDGGQSWERRGSVAKYIDRPWLTVDPNSGRLWWCGQMGEPTLGASVDGAATWTSPIRPQPAVRGNHRPTQPVVLSDGSMVCAMLWNPGGSGPPQFRAFRSEDGGTSVREVGRLPGAWRHPRLRPNAALGDYFPQLAVSGRGTKFQDRLYAVWVDGWTVDQKRVLLSRSDDRGMTWTSPVVISEQSMADKAGDYSVSMPTVAVNPAGVVAVCWYDCRAFPQAATVPSRGIRNAGYDIRLRASLDGGVTWGPSVKVNTQSAKEDPMEYGHTAGVTATADGRFFPAWIDDRTGRPQLWCAPCTVGTAE